MKITSGIDKKHLKKTQKQMITKRIKMNIQRTVKIYITIILIIIGIT